MRRLWILPWVLPLLACGQVQVQPTEPIVGPARLFDDHVLTGDGYRLPLYRRLPDGTPRAVVLALHGFGDYSAGFVPLADTLAQAGIAVHAYDQRGFGATEAPGIWAGQARMTADVGTVAALLRERYPDTPFYLLGKSMGGAVALLAVTGRQPPPVDGIVLVAPAIWGWDATPWYQRLGLRLLVRIAPGLELTGNAVRRLGIQPTDDPEVSRALSLDPLVQKRARVDTLLGLMELMDKALEAAVRLPGPALLLYGEQDQLIPPRAMCQLLDRLPDDQAWRMALYPRGFHMLTRYTGAAHTHQDLTAWLLAPQDPLPSGAEVTRDDARRRLCESAE
jgi:alpha-beta hydrolase superfamily lysophospholipase